VNLQTAESSRQIAELSQNDNAAMKIVSEKSVKVAELTRRDSSDMRIIAGVTLVFLPGTFTAVPFLLFTHPMLFTDFAQTLFSSTFFDFQPRDKPVVVSSWIWLYWAVTITLTGVVLCLWWLLSRQIRRPPIERLEKLTESSLEGAMRGNKVQNSCIARPTYPFSTLSRSADPLQRDGDALSNR
jgi:hypothetical protein